MAIAAAVCLMAIPQTTSWGQNTRLSSGGTSTANSALPQGRFLKRVRDEISNQDKKNSAESNTPAARERSANDLREATNPRGLTPPPAAQPSVLAVSGQAQPDPRLLATPPAASRLQLTPPLDDPRAPNRQTKPERNGPVAVGFGWKIEERKEQLFVTQVERGGNAERVGIKVGDQLVELGGIPIHTQDEYREIAGIFGEGDQIVVKLARGGKPYERDLQFGEAPDADVADPLPHANAAPGQQRPRSAAATPPTYGGNTGLGDVPDFAPPIVTPAASGGARPGQTPPITQPSLQPRPAPAANAPTAQHYEIQRLQQIVRQQQETIRQLQSELENLKKRPNNNNSRGLFGR